MTARLERAETLIPEKPGGFPAIVLHRERLRLEAAVRRRTLRSAPGRGGAAARFDAGDLLDQLGHQGSGRLLDTLSGPEAKVRSLATSADGKYLATSSITPPYEVWLWDLRRGGNAFRIEKRPSPLEGHNGPAFGLAFSPDGRSVATAGTDGQVILWESATGRRQGSPLIRPGSRERAWSVAFRPPHGRQLAAGYSGNLVITWDLDSGKERLLTGHTKDVYAVAYSPDGRWLASASWSEVILWDAETGNPVRKIDGYRGLIWAVAWSPDRPLLAVAGGRDGVGTIELWDVSDLPARAAAVGSGQ